MTTSAKIIADSISDSQIRITTMELSYPLIVHAEFMTHRMFSRNAASNRAIPTRKIIDQVEKNPFVPTYWGKDQPGMQADEELDSQDIRNSIITWNGACESAVFWAGELAEDGVHKQIANRVLMPYQYIKVIVTATEWDNFFNLRLAHDAQPEIQELAKQMEKSMDESTPKLLNPGEWHLPYVDKEKHTPFKNRLERIRCSAARCARVSYLNHDNTNSTIEKDTNLADKLLESVHMSPFEHQATPMTKSWDTFNDSMNNCLETGITHVDRNGDFWSANFRGWIQYRQLL